MRTDTAGKLLIDLDGTLAKREQPFNPYSVGEPVEKLLKAALAEKAKGRKIVCFTARAASKDKKMHATVRAWLDKHGLEGVEITNEKDRHITEIWDDRARGVVPDKGVFTDGKKASTPPDNPAQEVKAAKTMVRKERVEIQHDDHCPHCDHKFSEKGYPRPDFSKLPEDEDERQRMIMNGDYDEICPRCNGIVDPVEMTDEEIDALQESAWLSKADVRARRDKRRARIAARENVKEASLNKALVAGAAGAGIGGAVQLARRFMQSEDDRETHGAPSIINGMLVGGGAGALVGGLLPQTTTQVAAPAPPVPTAQQALTPQQINEILSGSLSLAEAQHTYYTHVSKGQFAPNIKALGSVDDKGGTVMVHRTWNASDAVPKPVPVHGYTYTLAPVAAGKEGVAIVAHAPQGPSYLSWLKDLKGGMIGATSAPTWEVPADHSSKLLELLRRNATGEDLSQFSPEKMPGTRLLENFGLPAAPGMDKKSAAGGFQRPENYDCISKLEKADVEIWAGANDWEEANTWMWAVHRPKGPDVNNESLVWVELKYPDLPHPGDTGVSSEDLAKIKQLAKRLPKEWEAEAKKIESPPTLEAFEKALQSAKLKPFVAASGFKDSRAGMRKWASAVPSSPPDTDVRGPRRLLQMLQNLDLAKLEAQAIADAKSGKITKRDKAVKILSAIEGLKRTNIKPEELMITRVPVLPPQFRPFSTMGTTFIPGSANELYQDLFRHRQAHKETLRELGEDMAGNTRLNLLNAVRALYGYGDPVSPKLQGRETKGYLKQVLGSGGPKFSFVQRKLLSRPIDSVGRGVITVDPDLDMNQISIPEELAWETYGSHVQRRLVQSLGMKPVEALKMVKDRTKEAQLALKQEMSPETGRPVIYSRAPAWHKFNTIAGWPKLHTGHNIAISPFVSAGLNADYDGDQCLNQLLACIPLAALPAWRMSYHNIDSHEIRFPQGSSIPTIQDGKIFLFDLEDFPHGELQRTKEGAKGRIDFHTVPHPIQVLAYDEQTGGLKWADVAFWSKHYQREIEIVDTHNGYQIITDDDPRAVYGTEAGALNMQRFTPTAAVTAKALVPRARHLPHITTTVCSTPGNQDSRDPRSIRMRDDVPLNSTVGWILGAMCGDGWVIKTEGRTKGFALADNDGHNVAKLRASVREILADGVTCSEWSVSSKASEPTRYGDTTSYRFTGMNVGNWFRSLIGGERDENTAGSANKHLPPFYLSAPEEFRSGLLCGLLDTDGSISVSNGKTNPQLMSNFGSTSIRLCIETKLLAASLGIFGRITPSQTPLGKPCWMLSFSNRDIQRWGAPFMCHEDKLKALRSVPPIQDSPVTAKYDIVPISQACADAVARAIGCPKISKKQRASADPTWLAGRKDTQALFMSFAQSRDPRHAKYGAVSRQQALRAINLLGRDTVAGVPDGPAWLQVVDNTEVTWERVTGVQKTGIKEDGYDLTVPGYETFMSADGIILSNTINVSVPILPESVEEAKKKLMPDKMLFAIRDQDSVMAQPKHEMVLGLYTSATRPSGRVFQFDSKQKAIAAVENGDVNYDDDIEFPGD